MILDIQEIINNKMKQMADDRVIEKQIEASIENTITKAVKDAFEGFELKRNIEKQLAEEVSTIVKDIGFTGYNQFIADTFAEMANTVLKEDIKQKIVHAFDDIFIKKYDSIKMSEICKMYRKYLVGIMDDEEKGELDNNFYVSFDDEQSDSLFKCINIVLSRKEIKRNYYSEKEDSLRIKLMAYKDDPLKIISVTWEGKDLSKLDELKCMTNYESFIASLYFNRTEIEMDIDEDDVDTSLGLDY